MAAHELRNGGGAVTGIDAVYRAESRRVLATLIRLLGSFELAEEAMHDAFAAAAAQWPRDGMPNNPRAWLVSAGRFKAIDRVRRRVRHDAATAALALEPVEEMSEPELDAETISDDQLRLIFTCCHPALAPEAQVALTLREVCGLTTEEIARAFLVAPTSLAQRIVRAKAKIRDTKIPYEVPEAAELPQRLATVLHTIYLVFNEGYSASSGATLVRHDLAGEAIRIGRLLLDLLPDPEAMGLLALMLLHDSRRETRSTPEGDIILLPDQDRGRWDLRQVTEGLALAQRALASGMAGPYALQAAIAAEHAAADTAADTDWPRIALLYDALLAVNPAPVVELNRAVAIAERDGPATGLGLIDDLLARGELATYRFAHSTRAELLRRLGRRAEARVAYGRALELTRQDAEQRFLRKRIRELPATD